MRIRLKYLFGKGIIAFGVFSVFLYFKEGLDYTFPFVILFVLFVVGYSLVSLSITKKNTNRNSIKKIK